MSNQKVKGNFLRQAQELRKSSEFAQACEYYAQAFQNEAEYCDKWAAWGFAYCLRKIGKYQQAILICQEGLPVWPDFQLLQNLYAWSLFDGLLASVKSDRTEEKKEQNLMAQAESILKNCCLEDEKSPYIATVFQILKYLKAKFPYNSGKILDWLGRLDYEKLSDTSRVFCDDKGRQIVQASHKEEYLSIKTKALVKAGFFSDCRELSEKALRELKKFSYNNDVWFKARIAYCHHQEGNLDAAIRLYQEVLCKKAEWFIYKELASVLVAKNQLPQALKYCVSGCLSFGDTTKKVGLFLLAADILEKMGDTHLAALHIKLVYMIRKSNDWRVDNDLLMRCQKYAVLEDKNVTEKGLLKTLRQKWEDLRFNESERKYGQIKSILPVGNAGFIRQDNGNSYFFRTSDFKGSRSKLEAGMAVSFYLVDSFDQKKNKPTQMATNIVCTALSEEKIAI